ncbi:MAG TPA: RNA polymerase factor sigma-54 [Verrucomicrobiae bacterium]|nr:RNA polymerase factor sigma-54 [Verrucomicrobiae bacterium]
MAQGLQLSQKMSLSQVLAPQLQQSLALLQAPTLELKALVEQELQQNPVLEELASIDMDHEEKTIRGETDRDSTDPAEPPADVTFDPAAEKTSGEPIDEFQAEFEKLAKLDQEWRDHFTATNAPLRQSEEEDEKRQYMFDSLVANTSLQETLLEQVRLSELDEEQRQIAEMIIGNIDDRGYLRATTSELAFSTNIPSEKIESVLTVIQSFHPAGVACRDLRECLMLQLQRTEKTDTLEYKILDQCFDALGKRKLPEIARALDTDIVDIQESIARIALLEPNPGRDFVAENQQYVVPEIFVTRQGEEFVVSTNNDQVPHLRISNHYKDIMAQAQSSGEVREWIREKIRAGKFLIKSLHQRQETILNIAKEIVKRQREFMEKGVAFLKPMTMVMVAEVVGVHETTVSRAVSGKYMQTPMGVFEMKYFFTSGIRTSNGEGMSNTSVKDLINEMMKVEDTSKPLSDEEIVKLLSAKGIVIARRTVAKYRSELNILPSHLRKMY